MPLTHKSSPYMKRYRLPSLKVSSSNVGRCHYYDDFSSPEDEQSEKVLSQILKSKKEFGKFKSSSGNNDTSNITTTFIQKSSISLLQKKEEKKITMDVDSKFNNNNNQEELLKMELQNNADTIKVKEIQKVIHNEIENLEKRFRELELLMKF